MKTKMATNKITEGTISKWGVPLFTINACLIGLLSIAVGSCFFASSRVVEKQFGFTSTQTSLIMVGDEFSGLILTIPYYISAASRDTTDMMSANETTTSTKLPDILCRTYTDNSSCMSDELFNNGTSKPTMNKNNKYVFYKFLLGKILIGAFSRTVWTMPFVYLNENCITSKATFFAGLLYYTFNITNSVRHSNNNCTSPTETKSDFCWT